MLQQTQVERVIPFYKKFIKKFPTAKKLAAAPLAGVLKAWQGLGYNRRAKQMRAAAQALVRDSRGLFPKTVAELEKFPGIGPYTARAVVAFAFNRDVVFVETNIRTAVTHHFFARKKAISDREIERVLTRALPTGRARDWYSALMDYGAHLKKSGVRLNKKSKHYTKQSKFTGSLREVRGAILRALAKKSYQGEALLNLLGLVHRAQMRAALAALERERLIQKTRRSYRLAE